MAEEKKFEAFDSDGNPIDGVVSPDEAKTLQAQFEETKLKLEKLENKEFNFKKLRDMTEAETAKLTATELSLKKQQEELEEKQRTFESSFITDIKHDVLSNIVGDDEELKKKVELNYARLKDSESAKSRSEIEKLMKEALTLSVGIRGTNSLNSAINKTGDAPKTQSSTKLSDEALAIGKMLGITPEDIEKYGK